MSFLWSESGTTYRKIPMVEDLDEYKPGGFHPVHLGDKLQDGRYTIIQKLGYGGASAVWLAHDTHENSAVALSVIMSRGPRGSLQRQAATAERLANGPDEHPGKKTVLIPLDSFELVGTNGTHTCLITAVMGQSISVATKRAQGVATRVLPLAAAQTAVTDLVAAVSYMTACGVVHADLHPGNLLLSLADNVDKIDKEAILEVVGSPRTITLDTPSGQPLSEHMPRYVVEAAFEHDLEPSIFTGHLKVSDFGDSFMKSDPPPQTSDIGPYLLPEYASRDRISCKADVWLLGCAAYQILSGIDLFGIPDDPAWLVTRKMMQTFWPTPRILHSGLGSSHETAGPDHRRGHVPT